MQTYCKERTETKEELAQYFSQESFSLQEIVEEAKDSEMIDVGTNTSSWSHDIGKNKNKLKKPKNVSI